MNMVKRYALNDVGQLEREASDVGQYVTYEDYSALLAKYEKAIDALAEVSSVLWNTGIHSHIETSNPAKYDDCTTCRAVRIADSFKDSQ